MASPVEMVEYVLNDIVGFVELLLWSFEEDNCDDGCKEEMSKRGG